MTRALSLSVLLLLLSLPALTGFALDTAAASTDPPQLVKLTNGSSDSFLLPDSRFLQGLNTVEGPSQGALAAWATTSGSTVNYGYASLLGSVPTANNVSEPSNSAPILQCGEPACPFLDDGYIRTLVNPNSILNAGLNVFDTQSGTSQVIPLHSPATPANRCTNSTDTIFCNFVSVYASGGGAVGVAPFPHVVNPGYPPVYSNEVVTWSGGQWTQLTPNDYEIVSTPCQYSNSAYSLVNSSLFFDPTVLAGFQAGDSGHLAYAMINYHLDGIGKTPSGGCYLIQHQTSVVMYVDGSPLDSLSFAPPTGNSTFNIQSCVSTRCFGGFTSYTGNLLQYSTYTGNQANSSYWVYDKSTGFTRQITQPDLSITDGGRLLWVTQSATNPGNNDVWAYDPGHLVYTNGTGASHVYSIGSFSGAQPIGIDGNTVLWYYTNSTSTYLQAYELYDQSALKGHLLPAVNIAGWIMYGIYVSGYTPPQLYYDDGMAVWMSASGNVTDPLEINVYNVAAAEAGQASLSTLGLGAYGFNSTSSILSSSLSQGWFFINGRTSSDPVAQVYTFDVTGLPLTQTTVGVASSSTGAASSSTSVQTDTTVPATTTAIQTSSAGQVTNTTAITTPGSPSPGNGLSTMQELDIAIVAAVGAIVLALAYFFSKRKGRKSHKPGDTGNPVSMTVEEKPGFDPVPPPPPPTDEEKNAEEEKSQEGREVG